MHKKFLLYLTDEESTLYHGPYKKLYAFKGSFEDAQHELKNFLSYDLKAHLCLFVDRSHQDIREEKIPPLFLWDRIRLLFYKKAEISAQGGYAGFQFLKEEKETYLRWIHIPPHDILTPWFLWAQTLLNPFGGIFFVPLEAGDFLKKHLSPSNGYQMLLYNLPSQQARHVIFKGRRLLLSRLSQGEDDLKTSIHFLSRTYPDIQEKLDVLSLVKNSRLTSPQLPTFLDPQTFLNFLALQKRPSLSIKSNASSVNLWLRKGARFIFISALVLGAINIYQGFYFKNKSLDIYHEIETLKIQVHDAKLFLQNKNVPILRKGLEHYHYLKSHASNPLKTIRKLSFLLNEHGIRLENFTWRHEQKLEMVLTFLMKDKKGSSLAAQFEAFLGSCTKVFPRSQVQVMTAPFNSSVHEIFKTPSNTSFPRAQVRIVFP